MLSKYSKIRLEQVIKEFGEFFEPTDLEFFYLYLGYPDLTPGDKETYALLKALSIQLKKGKKTNKLSITITVEMLALMLNTSEECQLNRLKKLKEYGLISSSKRLYASNRYIINPPILTHEFASKVIQIIRKNQILYLLHQFKKSKTIEHRIEIIHKIDLLLKRYKKHPDYNQIQKKVADVLGIRKQPNKKNISKPRLVVIK